MPPFPQTFQPQRYRPVQPRLPQNQTGGPGLPPPGSIAPVNTMVNTRAAPEALPNSPSGPMPFVPSGPTSPTGSTGYGGTQPSPTVGAAPRSMFQQIGDRFRAAPRPQGTLNPWAQARAARQRQAIDTVRNEVGRNGVPGGGGYRPDRLDLGPAAGDGTNRLDEDYGPSADPRLTGARTATDTAAGRVLGGNYGTELGANEARYRSLYGTGAVEGGPDVGTGESDRTAGYGTAQDEALANLTGGPNRTELARTALDDFDREGEIGLQNRFRRVGQSAAKFGNIGLGSVNAELGSIQGDYERNRLQKRNELIRDVSEGDINDRYRTIGAVSGLRGQEADLDTGRRGEQRLERAYDTDTGRYNAEQDFERQLAATGTARATTGAASDERYRQFGAAESLEDRLAGEGRADRGEARTEREFQQGEAQRTIDNRIRQRQLEDEAERLRISKAMASNVAGR